MLALTPTNAEQRRSMKVVLNNLYKMRDELMLLDMRDATPDKHAEYNLNLYDIGIAITLVNGAILKSISSDFAQQLPNFETATNNVAKDLFELRRTAQVLNVISKSMSTVASIITLLK